VSQSPYQAHNVLKTPDDPMALPRVVDLKPATELLRNNLGIPSIRPLRCMNVVAEFMVQRVTERHFAAKTESKRPTGPTPQRIVNQDDDARSATPPVTLVEST
jgi:hypothetical protein